MHLKAKLKQEVFTGSNSTQDSVLGIDTMEKHIEGLLASVSHISLTVLSLNYCSKSLRKAEINKS